MSQKIIIMGGVGNGTVIAQAIVDARKRGYEEYEVAGYFSDRLEIGTDIQGYPVLAKTSAENVKKYSEMGYKFIWTIYRIDGQEERLKLFNELGFSKENLATFIHPLAYVAPDVTVEPGVVIMPYAMISAATNIGMGTLIMTGATVGHDTRIGKFNHIASQAVVGSYLNVGDGVHFGLNCTVREHLTIGKNSTIGMGAVLTKDVGENEIWVGSPAKFLRKAE